MRTRTRSSGTRALFAVMGAVLAAAIWFAFAPRAIGGNVSYAIVTGQSMEPNLRADDLVLVRESGAYGLGDAVAYRSRNLGQIVLHRIVGRENGRFITKGDNNDHLDGDRPQTGDVLGKQWIRVPRAGIVFSVLRSPVGLGVGALAVLGMLGFFSVRQRRRRTSGRHRVRPGSSDGVVEPVVEPAVEPVLAPRPLRPSERPLKIAAVATSVCTVGFLALSFFAFGRPLFRTQTTEVGYRHAGRFSYSATAPDGPVYQSPTVSTGDPVFVRLVRRLRIRFDYAFQSDAPVEVTTSGHMDAVVSSDNGWTRSIPLDGVVRSTGEELTLDGRLDLAQIGDLLRAVERQTGMAPGAYSIRIEPSIETQGTLAGRRIDETFGPALGFQLDQIQLGLVRPEQDATKGSIAKLLAPKAAGSLDVKTSAAEPLRFAGRTFSVLAVRRSGLAGSGLGLLVLFAIGIAWMRRRPVDEAARIAARYSSLLIQVKDAPDLSQEAVDVADMETLARLAERFEQPVMHRDLGDRHVYMLYFDGLSYRYRVGFDGGEVIHLDNQPKVHAVLTRPSPLLDEVVEEGR